ncbi:MAG: efflux transporter outer membrane subunit [Prolixibacteraceae bacterium]
MVRGKIIVLAFFILSVLNQVSGQATGADTTELIPAEQIIISHGRDTLKPAPPVKATDQGWWQIFGYKKLDDLVKQALTRNHQLAAGQSQVSEADARVRLAKSSLFPSLGVNPSFTREELAANRPVPFDVPAEKVRYSTYLLPVELSYEVDLFGKNNSAKKASQYRYESVVASQQASELETAAYVAQNYILLLMLDSEWEVLKRTRLDRIENVDIVTTRYTAGLTNEMDVQRARTELSSVDVQIKNIQIERRNAELQLAALTGQPADSFSLDSDGIRFISPGVKPVSLSGLTINRPDLEAGKFNIEAYKQQVKNARRDRYPSLNLFGSAGLISAVPDKLFEGDSKNWVVGANLSIPVFEGRRRQSMLNITEFQLEGSMQNLKQNELVAGREVSQAIAELQRLKEQLSDQQAYLAAAFRTADLSRQRYKQGLVTYLEVVDAERIVLEAERLLVELIGRQLLSTVDLITSLGGDANQVFQTR